MDSPRSRRNTTSRLRATLQRWPAANGPIVDGFDIVPGKPVDSVDGLSPPSLTTGASATSARSISRLMTLITPVSSRTNSCPEKPGAAQFQKSNALLVAMWLFEQASPVHPGGRNGGENQAAAI